MISNEELELFTPMYMDKKIRSISFFWDRHTIYVRSMQFSQEITISRAKLKEMSLTKLLIRLITMANKKLRKINCYEGIDPIDNNYDFSEVVNYYIFEDGSVSSFQYHKYYRIVDLYRLVELPNINWEGVAFNLRCKKISEKLAHKLGTF